MGVSIQRIGRLHDIVTRLVNEDRYSDLHYFLETLDHETVLYLNKFICDIIEELVKGTECD